MVRKSPHEAGSALAGPAERTTKPAASAASTAPVLARLLDMVPPHLVPSALVRTLRDSQGVHVHEDVRGGRAAGLASTSIRQRVGLAARGIGHRGAKNWGR